jgi:hypothetical protein
MTTSPGSVARDLFIEGPAAQLSLLYDELSGISNKQSLRLSVGSDLDKLAKNFGLIRKQSTTSTGIALLTFSSLNATINVNKGASITANNGLSFVVNTGVSLIPSNLNYYRSVATQFQAQLAFAGITDQYAIQVTVIASAPGSSSNIGQYALSSTSISGVNNVTNVNAFNGGTDQETDAAFRNRILSAFSGSSVGTTLGYLNAALGTTGVQDAAVIGPGNPLMTRDGTVSAVENGVLTVISEGSGGKVDVVVLGTNEVQNTDTYIYQDKSNTGDPTNPKNNFVLGQIAADANKTINRRRIDDIANGQLPAQPVDTLLTVTGSLSGSNFTPKTTDSYGRVSGNFELIKDMGAYGGSPFGFDTFAWTSNAIDFQEDIVKGQNNGQDATTFTDVTEITSATQNLNITNENSAVTTDRSIIQLIHTPAASVTRVFNTNTGERYVVTNQNYDNTPTYNLTGRIQISGNTLPSPSDVLQVDYTWIIGFDPYSDFDGLKSTENPRPSTDSIDWGYASAVRNELIEFTAVTGNNYFIGNTSHPIDTVISTDNYLKIDGYIQQVQSGIFTGRLSVVTSFLAIATNTVDSVVLTNSNVELYDTAQSNGSFTSIPIVVGTNLLYTTTIILPSDAVASVNDVVSVYLNSTNVYQSSTAQGSSSGTQITIPSSLINTTGDSIVLKVTYIANVSDLYSSAVTSLPASRCGNGYNTLNNNGFNNFSIVNVSRRENQIVQKNLSNQYFVELSINTTDYSLLQGQVISIIRLSDGKELWNENNGGQIVNGTDGNYQLILTGFNAPVTNDRVLILYYALDVRRFQPFSFNNEVIKTSVNQLSLDVATNSFTVPISSFTAQVSGLSFNVIDANSDGYYFVVSDGYLSFNGSGQAQVTSPTVNFSTLPDITNKVVKIINASTPNNNGTYDILSYNASTNEITITLTTSHLIKDQIAVVRLLDGQELWNYSGTIDLVNNRLLIPVSTNASVGDEVFVMFFNFQNIRQAPTRIIGTIADQNVNTGVINIAGTTMTLAQDIVFTATATGLYQNLQEALRKTLNLNSSASIPSNIKIAKIVKLEKVDTYTIGSDIVLETLATYDIKNTTLSSNLYYAEDMLANPALSSLDFILPNTVNNSSTGATNNLPAIGDQLRITFYYTTDNDQESLSFTRIGTLYTNKKFALINKMYVSSGFGASQATKFTATSFTKPNLGARYTAFYDYLAPKQNERIVIQYNYNKLISDVTFSVENSRPINADVLVRGDKLAQLDLTINVVIAANYLNSTTTVLQNLRNQLVTALTSTTLGETIDQVTLINVAQAVTGISRARILYFNQTGLKGQILTFNANGDQGFEPNNIIINTEVR